MPQSPGTRRQGQAGRAQDRGAEAGEGNARRSPRRRVWCVFDRDQHEHFTEACNLAEGCGVQLAVSNPCFELWVLLHFEYRNTAVHRHDVQRILADKAYIPAYDKAMPGLFAALEDRMAAATRHAEQLRAAHAAVAALPRSNPSSDVDLLLKSLGVVK
ncbi:MAG: RloB family protein [Myxococcota bacterium]